MAHHDKNGFNIRVFDTNTKKYLPLKIVVRGHLNTPLGFKLELQTVDYFQQSVGGALLFDQS